jgi:hypothetical protein
MEETPSTTNKKLLYFQQLYSSLLLIFCITLIMGSIFTKQTRLSAEVHPAVAFFVLIIGVVWLTMVEVRLSQH